MPRYWFRQKTFGYGATPNTWQGWTLTIVSLLLIFGLVLVGPSIRDNVQRTLFLIGGAAIVLVPCTIIAHRKTEGGWRWRSGRE